MMKVRPACLAAVLIASAKSVAAHSPFNNCKLLENPFDVDVIPDQVIVVFDSAVDVNAKVAEYNGAACAGSKKFVHEYRSTVKGLTIKDFTECHCNLVEQDPDVLYTQQVSFQSTCFLDLYGTYTHTASSLSRTL
jgi:hypothetical protein